MRLLVTGAAGFVGREVVEEALRRGHEVCALVRPATDAGWLTRRADSAVTVVRGDLRRTEGLAAAVDGVDAVVHLAAAMQGDLHAQLASTVVGTENLLEAMIEAGTSRLIAVSTISVYDFLAVRSYAKLDESCALEADLERRETYAQSKLVQEELVRRYAADHGLALTVVRPGFVYGPDHLWTDQLGLRFGNRCCLRFAVLTRLPLTYVGNCAAAIVLCAESDAAVGQVFNVVDNDRPTRRAYLRELKRRKAAPSLSLPVPGLAVRALARVALWTNRLVFRNRAKLPWMASPAKLHVQIKPLRFSNERIRRMLDWTPRYSAREAWDRIFNSGE